MHRILVFRPLTPAELAAIGKQQDHPGVEVRVHDALPTLPGQQKLIPLTESEKKDINYRMMDEVLAFGDYVVQGKPISARLHLQGAGLWYYHKFRIYFSLRNRQYHLAEIRKNLTSATKATIYTDDTSLSAGDFDIPVQVIAAAKKKSRLALKSILAYGFTVLFRLLKAWLTPMKKFSIRPILCIDTADQYRQLLHPDGRQEIFENAFLGYFYQQYSNECAFVDQLLVPSFKGPDRYRYNPKYLRLPADGAGARKRLRMYAERIITGGLLSPKVHQQARQAVNTLKAEYEILQKELQPGSSAYDISVMLKRLHNSSAFYLYKYFCYDRFFARHKFGCVLTTDENSPNFKIILDAARHHSIPTAGYQHGNIHALHPAYRYSRTDLAVQPMPDLTITWGEKWKDLLVQTGHYPAESIAMAGQVRTDVIPAMQADRQELKKKMFPSAAEKNIILFATQPQRDPALRRRAAEDVVDACLLQNNTHLVFKLHPREKDPSYYANIATDRGLTQFTIAMKHDLYSLLNISDIVITCFSTVGTEAQYFRKPLIILDHLRQDILNYYSDGVALQAVDAPSLSAHLHDLLQGKTQLDPAKIEAYITTSAYRIDGQAAARVRELVRQLASKRRI